MDPVHDFAKELIGSAMVAAATWLGERVRRAVRDVNCLFNRVRAIEEHLKIDPPKKENGQCSSNSSSSRC